MISDSQLWRYINAHLELEEAERNYLVEREQVYENIAPTMTGFDIGSGRIYKKGCDVEGTAIHLVELNEKRLKIIDKVKKNAQVLKEALTLLYDDERALYESWKANPDVLYLSVSEPLKECISYVLEQQRIDKPPEEMSVREWDKYVEEMSDEELFQDYWDKDDTFDESLMKRQAWEKEYGIVRKKKKDLAMS